MATLNQIYSLLAGSPDLEQRFLAARVHASWDIYNESGSTENHANRLLWAESIMDEYYVRKSPEYIRFLSNSTIQTSGVSSSDNDIQFVVNCLINIYANNLAGG
jgi:hypothetical protein